MKAVELIVRGRVQGVSYRASTRAKAIELGLTGWVRNEPDGTVRAWAQGPEAELDAWVEWCNRGPTYARVTDVEVDAAEPDSSITTFVVRR